MSQAHEEQVLKEAIKINDLEMERLRLELRERQVHARHLARAVEAIGEKTTQNLQSTQSSAEVPNDFGTRKRARRSSLAWVVRRKTYVILKRLGRPVPRQELYQELINSGVEFRTRDPLKAITKIISEARKEFQSTDSGYWFKSDPSTADENST